MAGKLLPIVDMTDILSKLPAIAYVSSNSSALVAECSKSLLLPSQTGRNPWPSQYLCTKPRGSPAVLGTQETVQCIAQRAREARNGRRALPRQQKDFSLMLVNMMRLRRKNLSMIWQEAWYTFDSSKKKQMTIIFWWKKKGNYFWEASPALEDHRKKKSQRK